MEPSIVIAGISLVGTIIAGMIAYFANKKASEANARKSNAEADAIYLKLKDEAIEELKKRVNHLETKIEEMQKQESIHFTEKTRLEERLTKLKEENEELRNENKISKGKIDELTSRINRLRKDITEMKLKDEKAK